MQKWRWIVAIVLMAPSLWFEQANAGPFTDATNINRVCNEAGRTLGALAFKFHEGRKRRGPDYKDRIKQAKSELAQAQRGGDKDAVDTHRKMLGMYTEIQASRDEADRKARNIHLSFAEDAYSKSWRPIAAEIWRQVSPVNDEDQARDLGYAVCVDYVSGLGRGK